MNERVAVRQPCCITVTPLPIRRAHPTHDSHIVSRLHSAAEPSQTGNHTDDSALVEHSVGVRERAVAVDVHRGMRQIEQRVLSR
jgi:hypothetical protein